MSEGLKPSSAGEVLTRCRAWVRENFLYMRPDWTLGDDDPLLGTGVIDSVGVIELVEFLQGTFGLSIGEDEITEGNLGSLAAIGRFVYHKCHENGSGAHGLQVA
ncbi:MAG: acyl carrier protein [Gemmatimonadetes bacterium]|nr:acyl carrier protein [Gemmatimonadota bacterium]